MASEQQAEGLGQLGHDGQDRRDSGRDSGFYEYNLTNPNGSWLANVVLTERGMIAIVSDWGSSVFKFSAPGKNGIRHFLLNVDPGYLGQKFAGTVYYLNGRPTRETDKRCFNLCQKVLPALKDAIQAEQSPTTEAKA